MTPKRYIDKFNELFSTYVADNHANTNRGGGKLLYLIDYIWAFCTQGASISDYFLYRFYLLNAKGRRSYITLRRHRKIQRVCNNPRSICWFRDKSLFNQRFAKYLHRSFLDINLCNETEFTEFYNRHKVLFVKDVEGYCAIGIECCRIEKESPHSLWVRLNTEKKSHYIVEAQCHERPEVASFHMASVNTIRVVTVYDNHSDKVNVMLARLRMGNKGYPFDNFHYDGICANIDLKTGIITSVGYDRKDKEYIYHPESKQQIVGFHMPDWDKIIAFVEEVARVVPDVRYVGWDIVPLENGNYALIEGNDNADHDLQQMHNRGLWKDYKKLLKELK